MAKTLVVAAITWPILLGAAVWTWVCGDRPLWVAVVYAACSWICHQIPERSFHTAAVQWPVCARCAGLYLSAPAGALAAFRALRQPVVMPERWSAMRIVAVAAIPTAATLAVEWAGLAAPSNLLRALAALPLGSAVAFVMVRASTGPRKAIG
jgi:uncharacterized membrane protein